MTVDDFLSKLKHKKHAEIEALRKVILASNSKLTEQVKWNAPSFCFNGDDRVTMRLQPGDRLELIFHRGAKVKDPKGFAFEDETGLLRWAAKDRGVLELGNLKDVAAKKKKIAWLVNAWVKATT